MLFLNSFFVAFVILKLFRSAGTQTAINEPYDNPFLCPAGSSAEKSNGSIYVLSDIHGNMRRFLSILSQIKLQPEDTLYILGDCIDRHKDGIRILQMVSEMENAVLLLGNHELMMRDVILQDLSDSVSEHYNEDVELWYWNGGKKTHRDFLRLPIKEQRKLARYLQSLPVQLDVTVNGRLFRLVHAAPIEWYPEFKDQDDYRDAVEFAVWHRFEGAYPSPADYTIVFGHTPTEEYTDASPLRIWFHDHVIDIDCGSGYPEKDDPAYPCSGNLACLRLNDMKEYYSQETGS